MPRHGQPAHRYPRIEYPRIEDPRIEYPRIEYSAIENPRIEYPAGAGHSALVTEVTWPVTSSTGDTATSANTTTAMTAKAFVNGGLPAGATAQLLVTVPYQTGVANSCYPGDSGPIVDNQVIVNNVVASGELTATSTAQLEPPDVVNPPSSQPSFPVKPGQTVWVTLRIRGINGVAGEQLARRAGLWVQSQPDTVANNAHGRGDGRRNRPHGALVLDPTRHGSWSRRGDRPRRRGSHVDLPKRRTPWTRRPL